MGSTTPITNADMTSVQSRLENLNMVWTIYDKISTIMTTMICAVSIPSANSDNGSSLDCGDPPSNVLK